MWAKELSEIKSQLDAHNIGLVGVGLEELGLQAFLDGGFFKGDLYIDLKKECYQNLDFRRYNAITVIGGLAAKETRQALSRSNALGIKGDFKGDTMQIGGELVVSKGGEKVLLFHKQANPGDHPKMEDILKALSIDPAVAEGAASSSNNEKEAVVCEDVCAIKPKESEAKASDEGQPEAPTEAVADSSQGGKADSP